MQDIKVSGSGGIILLGKQGENLARKIQFDISRWISTFGPGTVQLLHQRSGDEAPYPVAVEQDGTLAVWKVSSADTAAAGTGRTELQYYVGDVLAKSETWMTKVLPALGDASETPPEAQQGWVDQVLQAGAAAVEAAEKAENAAVRQPYPNAETGTWWVWDAESGAYTDTGVSYGTGGGGTSDHDKLLGRDKAEQHPMSAITGLVDALAGKQPTGAYLTEETDPTVPDWAKAATKPGYTAAEVGADPAGTAVARVSEHNTEATAHRDMRLLIQGLTDRISALADSDDTTLDQLSEIVAYIKSNRDLIAAITTDKVSVGDIVNDLVTNVANKPLSAAQGVALKALIDSLSEEIAKLPSGSGGLTTAQIEALDGMFKVCAFIKDDVSAEYAAFKGAFGITDSEDSMTLTSISATYTGGDVAVGTAVSDLKGIVVTATYSDGSTATVTEYTLSGTIAEGSNTITVSYGGETTTFTVTGVAESSGGIVNLFDKDTMVVSGAFVGANGVLSTSATSKYAKIPVSVGTYALQKGSGWGMSTTGHPALIDSVGNVLCYFTTLQASGNGGNSSEPTVGTITQEANGNGIAVTVLSENVTHIIFSICVNGGTDDTDTTMMEVGDTCHDYVAYVL
ncbi:bacterial Ig-like domain-containing protein [Evtepia sp.]|uniref:bacterial Ig-like domain-containing protein n=1 Tax=Evtepia sp. TaxID=2773933 RepID=UPI003F1570F2